MKTLLIDLNKLDDAGLECYLILKKSMLKYKEEELKAKTEIERNIEKANDSGVEEPELPEAFEQ